LNSRAGGAHGNFFIQRPHRDEDDAPDTKQFPSPPVAPTLPDYSFIRATGFQLVGSDSLSQVPVEIRSSSPSAFDYAGQGLGQIEAHVDRATQRYCGMLISGDGAGVSYG